MKKNRLVIILSFCLVITSCQTLKDGLSGNKNNNSDEFLVQKKNPLVLPPKYLELPKPQGEESETEKELFNSDNLDIQKILGIDAESINLPSTQSGNAEEFVLKNIKNN